jgi:ElaB/YqjD/DUF883 family membrane-anchored ribosome-binding protein
MANEDMIGSSGSEVRDKGTRGQEEPTEELKSAIPSMVKDYAEKGSAVLGEAKNRVRTLREDGEDYVRTNPMKAVLTALGVGFMLGVTLKR